MSTDEKIERLLAESSENARARERSWFAEQLGERRLVVIFGAGRLGRACARAVRRAGLEPAIFCDNNPLLVGTTLEGSPVMTPAAAAARFGGDALFIVGIWTGTARESTAERIQQLRALGVRHVVSFPALLWAHGSDELPFHAFDLPSRVLEKRSNLQTIGVSLGDEVSKRTFLAELERRLLGEFSRTEPQPDQYFPPDLVCFGMDECFVDAGAFTGDTLIALASRLPSPFLGYHAFEPDPANACALRSTVERLPDALRSRVRVYANALADIEREISFSTGSGATSHILSSGECHSSGETKTISSLRLDCVPGVQGITFLKLDVEGAERACLLGAEEVLRRDRPSVAVCTYHRSEDLCTLPVHLMDRLPGHRFHYRMHGQDGWESVFYAIRPEHRP